MTAFIAGYVLVLSLLAPVFATHADHIAKHFTHPHSSSPTPDVIPTGGIA